VTPWQLSDAGERYVSSSRHAADVQTAIRECLSPRASRLPTVTARADEPEGNPTDRVAANPAVIDTDTDATYRDGVELHPVECDAAPAFTSAGGDSDSTVDSPSALGTTWSDPAVRGAVRECLEPRWTEADRQAWLRRVQAER